MELSDSDFSDAGEDHERETKKNKHVNFIQF